MTSWIQELRGFVGAPSPRFRCSDTDGTAAHWVAQLRHELAAPASESELRTLAEHFAQRVPQEFIDFYSQHNGATLYQDTIVNAAGFRTTGIRVAPVSEWPLLAELLDDWIESLDEDEREDLVPSWTQDAIVFAEVPNSGNYFLCVASGEKRGQIVYFDHDGFEFEAFAPSLSAFFSKVTAEPAQLLYGLGCYARYADGETDTQWIPDQYLTGR
jgi:hypothetical protein